MIHINCKLHEDNASIVDFGILGSAQVIARNPRELAEHIVKCVNLFPELVAALQLAEMSMKTISAHNEALGLKIIQGVLAKTGG